jgi:hypothetical protein
VVGEGLAEHQGVGIGLGLQGGGAGDFDIQHKDRSFDDVK